MPPKSKKKPMNAKFEFWNHLPIEMRMECIKRMDFKTRMQLRATTKQDKLLVESTRKYHFDSVEIHLDLHNGLEVVYKDLQRSEVKKSLYCKGKATRGFFRKAEQLVIQILKFSTTENIDFDSNFKNDEDVSNFLANFTNPMAFHFKKIALCCQKKEIVQFFLKNCESAETVQIVRPFPKPYGPEFMNILQLPVIINAKTVELRNLEAPETLYQNAPRTTNIHQLINNWLEKDDLELGKTFKMCYFTIKPTDFLAKKFKNRVVSETEGSLRIRSNDSKKHILINWLCNRYIISALVIPSDQKEPE